MGGSGGSGWGVRVDMNEELNENTKKKLLFFWGGSGGSGGGVGLGRSGWM